MEKSSNEIIRRIQDYALEEIIGDRFGKYAKEIISTDNELYGTDLLDKMLELEQGSD